MAFQGSVIHSGAMSSKVRNNAKLSRFELELDGGEMAFAQYRLHNGVMTFTHTEVPPLSRKYGTGSRLVHGALELARADQVRVVARCSFVADYLARHPEFSDIVA